MQVVGLNVPLSISNFVKYENSKLDQRMDTRQINNKVKLCTLGQAGVYFTSL